jgi:hypothetical protein
VTVSAAKSAAGRLVTVIVGLLIVAISVIRL